MTLTRGQVRAIREGEPISIVPAEPGEECVVLREDAYSDPPSGQFVQCVLGSAEG
jgi:hypothetical protein